MDSRSFDHRFRNAPIRKNDSRTIVFVNANIPNYATIIQRINPKARAFIIDSQINGVQSITQILASSCCKEVHIVATGRPGCVYLGKQELSLNTLIQYEDELRSWFDFSVEQTAISSIISANSWIDSLAVVPHISLYGCNIAAGDGGAECISRLSRITKAKILASKDILRHRVFCDDEEYLSHKGI